MCARPLFTPRPSHLHEASSPQHTLCVRAVYNEVILDDKTFVRSLPLSIDAVFFLPSACDDIFDGPKCEAYARGAHRNILRHFELTEAQQMAVPTSRGSTTDVQHGISIRRWHVEVLMPGAPS